MAKVLNLYEAKTQLSSLVEEAAAGNEYRYRQSGRPPRPARSASHAPPPPARGIEGANSRIAADFDAPLPPDILEGFIGKPR